MQLITAFLGTLGFGVLFNIRGRKLWLAALGGLLSWGFFLLLGLWMENEPVRYFLCSVLVSVYAEILARVVKTPTTTFIIISLIPLIPGGSLYYTMASALEGSGPRFLHNGVHTLSLAIALSLGIILVTSFVRRLKILKK
ncbi:MAG: threonine/serine exporter family protein [Clostridia bacterium]|nr:threonine/serine exporter family protein [Clostridia bacterium]